MTAGLSRSDRRALVLGAVVVVTLVGSFRGAPAWRRWREDVRLSALQVMSEAQRTDTVIAVFQVSLDSLEAQVHRFVAISSQLQPGKTPADAAQACRSLIWDMARRSGVRLDVTDVGVDTSSYRELPRLVIKATAQADIVGVASFLREIEGNAALLSVSRLVIKPDDPQGMPNVPEHLSLQLTVVGLGLVRSDAEEAR